MGESTEEAPRKRGRPAKSEGEKAPKKKATESAPSSDEKKGRGRPKGSKNKPMKITPKSKTTKRGRPAKPAAPVEEEEEEEEADE